MAIRSLYNMISDCSLLPISDSSPLLSYLSNQSMKQYTHKIKLICEKTGKSFSVKILDCFFTFYEKGKGKK